jgi:predicted Zn-dependent protease
MTQQLIIEKINKAKLFLSSNKIQEAKNELLDCIKLNKDETQIYYYLTKIYIKENKEKEAIECLQEAINFNPKNIQYYLFLAEIYFNNLSEFLYKLIDLYENVLLMNYVDDVILYRLSFLYHKTLNLNKSNEYLAKLYSYNRMQPQVNLLKQYTTISALAFNYNYKKQEDFHKKYKNFIKNRVCFW